MTGQSDKHYLLRKIIPLDKGHANVSDVFFQRRWSVLRSVDDMVSRFLATLKAAKALDNTYIIYTSDHGYHLGEFGMLYDKRMLYETDIRIPLLVRGPGIAAAQLPAQAATHVDLAPTILDMAGVLAGSAMAHNMDGRSWLPLVKTALVKNRGSGSSAAADAAAAAAATAAATAWRTEFMVEYSGGNPLPNGVDGRSTAHIDTVEAATAAKVVNVAAMAEVAVSVEAGGEAGEADVEAEAALFALSIPLRRNASCSASADDELSILGKCSCSVGRISGFQHDMNPCDGRNNTYACVRTVVVAAVGEKAEATGGGAKGGVNAATMDAVDEGSVANGDAVTLPASLSKNTMYCEFNDPEHFVEYYDLNTDPYNLHNLAASTPEAELKAMHARLLQHQACKGAGCFDPPHI